MSIAMDTALSAMMVAQRTSEVVSHNIANSNTPGYSRQVAVLQPSLPIRTTAGLIGTGVTIDSIMSIKDEFLNMRISAQETGLGRAEVLSKALAELEAIIVPGPDSTLGRAIDDFFVAVNELSTNAENAVSRESVSQTASTLCATFRATTTQLRQLRSHIKDEYDEMIDQANSYFEQIADLNDRIMAMSDESNTANDLTDQRDHVIEELSKIVPLQIANEGHAANVLFEGQLMVSGSVHLTINSDSTDGTLKLRITGSSEAFSTAGGVLGGQAALYNEMIPSYIDHVDELAGSLIATFNAVHSTGVGLQNGYTSLTSTAELADMDLNEIVGDEPLGQQSLAFPSSAGALYITVTNDNTGEINRSAVNYDPSVDSIVDIAEKIAAVPHMNASVTSGFLTLTAWPGYRFDFSNKLLPEGGALGTSAITVSGAYTGDGDRALTFYPMSSGIVGESEDLRVAVIDDMGSFLGLLDVGDDYSPGAALHVGDGVKVSFSAGNVQAAQLQTSDEPFGLADLDELTVSLDGGPPSTITFAAADFEDISQATAEEVALVINNADVGVEAAAVSGSVMIRPSVAGPGSSIEVGGSAAAALGLTTDPITTDSQTIDLLGQTDTGGLLTALGINAFFEGDAGGNITVSSHIKANVDNIAAAKSSPPGDNANAVRLAQIKHEQVADDNSQTLNEFFAALMGKAGIDTSHALRSLGTQMKLVENLERQRDSIAGVSIEEEMAKLMQCQQAYFAAIKLIQTVDEMLTKLAIL